MPYYLLMLIASLLHTATFTVYYVMPDDHYHPINDNTYTLQHYLNNTNKYFTSNTELHFLPGQYYLNNDLIIQGVSNFSLIGNRTNEVVNTVINCTSPAGIAVVGSSNIVIANIVMNECGNDYKSFLGNETQGWYKKRLKTLVVFYCKAITLKYFYSLWHKLCGIELVNALGSKLSHLISNYLYIQYSGNTGTTNITDTLYIKHFQVYSAFTNIYTIQIEWHNINFNFNAKLLNVNFTKDMTLYIACTEYLGQNIITVDNCSFNSMISYATIYDIIDNETKYVYYERILIQFMNINRTSQNASKIYFNDCQFINNYKQKFITILNYLTINHSDKKPVVFINGCIFYNNQNMQLISASTGCDTKSTLKDCARAYMLIKNTKILTNSHKSDLIVLPNVILTLEEVKIINNTVYNSIIYTFSESFISKYNEISSNYAGSALEVIALYVYENSMLNITLNIFKFYFTGRISHNYNGIDMCSFQYISKRGNLDEEFHMGIMINYSLIFYSNNMPSISYVDSEHCEWDTMSAFSTSSSLHVNHRFIHYQHNKLSPYFISYRWLLIYLCYDNNSLAYYTKEMGPFYPGETVSFRFILNSNITKMALLDRCQYSHIECKNDNFSVSYINDHTCKDIKYTIMHENGRWCELCFNVFPINSNIVSKLQIYTITLKPCPLGFLLHLNGYCQCDPILSSYIPSLTHCNIDDQTIPRPANSWISAHTVNNSHSYHVSLYCPFDYCLPHSSHLNLSTPDSQCQFNRSGLLCGQCQQGLSAVFGSSQCKVCSNVYLLIIMPIGIAGLALVLLLFALNLTVTDGNINTFLFYVNVISINTPTLFVDNAITHVLISLANLDLGITTCFYNGMDNYAKMWLELVFPVYLILIATAFIIVNNYSIRIKRFTVRKAQPVLATLLLLSYTKILLAVSKTLFFYSATVHLPRNHTTILWSLDATVPWNGSKFITVFIVCIILLVTLLSLNILLIFSRQLLHFKCIKFVKPQLDAYQHPYRKNFHFYIGLQNLIRALLFGLSALEKHVNLSISIILFGVLIWVTGRFSPFKSAKNNTLEALFLLNLLMMFTSAISLEQTASSVITSVLISLAMFKLLFIVALHAKDIFCRTDSWRRYKCNFIKVTDNCFGKSSANH